jgi:Zn-dependent protease with chaperone function
VYASTRLIIRSIVIALLIWIPYWFIAKRPRSWWLYCSAASILLLVGVLLIVQIWLVPRSTPIRPLAPGPLATRIETLAARCGINGIPIYVGGNDTTVVGLGPTSRIILANDTVSELSEPEQIAVVGHELKHYVLHDNWKGIGVVAALIVAGLWLVYFAGRRALRLWSNRFGFSELSDPASLPLMALILTVGWVLLGLPIFNAVQRHVEWEADRFSLELTHENRGEAMVQVRYSKHKLNEYDWFYRIFRANHPSQADRVRLANEYQPWVHREPIVYGKACNMPR